jgi:hypothetical protein
MAGKGDKPRPIVKKQYDSNFDKIVWNKPNVFKEVKQKNNKIIYKY